MFYDDDDLEALPNACETRKSRKKKENAVALMCWGRIGYALGKKSEIFLPSFLFKGKPSEEDIDMAFHVLSRPTQKPPDPFSVYDTVVDENDLVEETVSVNEEASSTSGKAVSINAANSSQESTTNLSEEINGHADVEEEEEFQIPIATTILPKKKEEEDLPHAKSKTKKKKKNKTKTNLLSTTFEQKMNLLDNTRTNRFTLNFDYPSDIEQKMENAIQKNVSSNDNQNDSSIETETHIESKHVPGSLMELAQSILVKPQETMSKDVLSEAKVESNGAKPMTCLVIENLPTDVDHDYIEQCVKLFSQDIVVDWTETKTSVTSRIYVNSNERDVPLDWIMEALLEYFQERGFATESQMYIEDL